ncbi:hypothetical protein VKT23_003040 [Stygiomarasmius scandens]|uniref:Uncharacterized protein n=1 Tax=Marasmiellus scandens TaxID=2682957 RepID=A0ABR1JWJ5_9AGAR
MPILAQAAGAAQKAIVHAATPISTPAPELQTPIPITPAPAQVHALAQTPTQVTVPPQALPVNRTDTIIPVQCPPGQAGSGRNGFSLQEAIGLENQAIHYHNFKWLVRNNADPDVISHICHKVAANDNYFVRLASQDTGQSGTI